MSFFSDIADWWDEQAKATKQILESWVESNPSMFKVVVATAVSTAIDVGAGTVDVLRLGKGISEKGLAGVPEDLMRGLELVPGLGKAAKAAKPALKAMGKAVSKCPLLAKKAAAKLAKLTSKPAVNAVDQASPPCKKCRTGGEPVSMVTGEELVQLEDFVWSVPLELRWARLYRTAQAGIDLQLGHGWLTPLDEWIEIAGTRVFYHDCEGRRTEFDLPEPGVVAINVVEGIRLWRDPDGLRLRPEDGPDRIFTPTDRRWRLARLEDVYGQSIEIIQGPDGLPSALVATGGRALLIEREAGRIVAVTPAGVSAQGVTPIAAPVIRYRYDDAGDLVAVLNRVDAGESYAYRDHVIVKRTLASGFSFHFEWDRYTPEGRCLRNWGDGGIYDTRFEWTDSGISRAIDSRGGVSEYLHDRNARLLREVTPEGCRTEYAYDENNLLHAITDPAGGVTRHGYDGEGRLVEIVDALERRTQIVYDATTGRPCAVVDPLGQKWEHRLDSRGRVVEATDPTGATTRFAYNEQGLLAKVTDAVDRTRTLLWDERARLVGEIGFDGIRRRYAYDAEDRIVAMALQDRLTTTYAYDPVGRLIAVTGPDGALTRMRYDAAGQLTQFIDPNGLATTYRYGEGLNQITERVEPDGRVVRYHYDSERNLVGLTNGKGESYGLAYDKDERLIEEIGFDGRTQRYHYDLAGRLDAHAQRGDPAAGQPQWLVTRFERDLAGRLLRKLSPDGAVTTFAYDPLDRLMGASNVHTEIGFAYDPAGRVIKEIQGEAVVERVYDKLGRRTATIAPGPHRIDYDYDKLGRVERVRFDDAELTSLGYDDLGQEVTRLQGELVSRQDYDPAGRLIRQSASIAGSKAEVISRRYGYDAAGRVTSIDDIRRGPTRYHYDPADRLLRVEGMTPEQFVHDPANNIVAINGASGGLVKGDRLLMMGDRHFFYDAAGNRIEERRGREGPVLARYAYDGDNRMVRAETAAGVSTYRYDPLGRRVAKATPMAETRFVYDGARLLGERGGEETVTYVFEVEGFRPLAQVRHSGAGGTGVVGYYQVDHLGTPQEVTDARGRVVWSGRYRAYGAVALAEEALVDNRLRFQGQYHDVETGLYYTLNRYHDPRVGSFVSQDPIALLGGEQLYSYVVNPANWVDPIGLMCALAESKSIVPGNKTPARGYHKEVFAPKPVSASEVTKKWDEFLGPGPHTNIHPRTGAVDPNRIVSADGRRSIRYGSHEMDSSPTKHHYHEETWTYDSASNVMNVDNTVVRIKK